MVLLANGVAPQLSLSPADGAATLAGGGRRRGGDSVFVAAAGFCVLRGVVVGGSRGPGIGGVWGATGGHRNRFWVRDVVLLVVVVVMLLLMLNGQSVCFVLLGLMCFR